MILDDFFNQNDSINLQTWQDYNKWIQKNKRVVGMPSVLDFLEAIHGIVIYPYYQKSQWGVVVNIDKDSKPRRVTISRNCTTRETSKEEGLRYVMKNVLKSSYS